MQLYHFHRKRLVLLFSATMKNPPERKSNGIVERLHRTFLDEYFKIQGRAKFHESLRKSRKT
jgi:hypothetical protein